MTSTVRTGQFKFTDERGRRQRVFAVRRFAGRSVTGFAQWPTTDEWVVVDQTDGTEVVVFADAAFRVPRVWASQTGVRTN